MPPPIEKSGGIGKSITPREPVEIFQNISGRGRPAAHTEPGKAWTGSPGVRGAGLVRGESGLA